MAQPVVKLRDPFPPHRELGVVDVGELKYGFAIGESTQVKFHVSRADPNAPEHFQEGTMISIERATDNAHLWVGFISEAIDDLDGPVSVITCTDIFGSLFATGRAVSNWPEQQASLGEMIRRILGEADARGEPPLLVEFPTTFGPVINYTPRAEPLTDFMRTMVDFSDWEWSIDSEIRGVGLRHRLISRPRLGRDLSNQIAFEDRQHFVKAKLQRKASAYVRAALAVGGTGDFASRPAAIATPDAAAIVGAVPQASDPAVATSPALMGSRVIIDQSVTNESALQVGARRLHHSHEFVKHKLTFTIHESQNVDGVEAFDMTKLELGSLYRCRFNDLALGRQYNRVVRVIGYSFDTASGAVPLVVEVLGEFDIAAA